MPRKLLILLGLYTTLLGCATAELSKKAQSVRVVGTTPQNCKYIGPIEAKSNGITWSKNAQIESAIAVAKNTAGESGANTIEIIERHVPVFAKGYVKAETYKCDE